MFLHTQLRHLYTLSYHFCCCCFVLSNNSISFILNSLVSSIILYNALGKNFVSKMSKSVESVLPISAAQRQISCCFLLLLLVLEVRNLCS